MRILNWLLISFLLTCCSPAYYIGRAQRNIQKAMILDPTVKSDLVTSDTTKRIRHKPPVDFAPVT